MHVSIALSAVHTTGSASPTAWDVNLEVDQSIGLFPFSGHLSSDSDGTIASYTWHWDDGTPDDVAEFASVGHHLSVGVHAVQLTVTDNEGASDTDTITVTVKNVAPYVFAEDSVRVPPGSRVSYSASVSDAGGSDEITSVIWDFADGTTASGTVVNHTYATLGQFDVTITATDAFGAVSTKHMAVDVKPVAADAGPDQSRVEGDQVELGGPNSSPADGSVNYVWDFGDGSEPGSGRTASHMFPRNGTYTVTQTATDEGGTATDRAVITVANADPVISAVFGSGPTAVGDRVSLRAVATDAGPEDVLTYTWNFGDGSTGTGRAPLHAYSAPGTYHAVLTVTDGDGGHATASA